jgi:hypothetical protein
MEVSMNQSEKSVDMETLGKQLVEKCHDKAGFMELLEELSPQAVLDAQNFMWGFVNHMLNQQHPELSTAEVSREMRSRLNQIPDTQYQYQVGCNEREDYCRANICVFTNPNCSAKKLRLHMEALRELLS